MRSSYLHRVAALIVTAGVVGSMPMAAGDDTATVLQYELGLGGKNPVRTFYLGFQSTGPNSFEPFAGSEPSLRIPLYSSDPHIRTTFSQFSASETEDKGANILGEVLGTVVVVLYFAAPWYATLKALKDLGDFEIDVPPLELPPEAPAAPSNE